MTDKRSPLWFWIALVAIALLLVLVPHSATFRHVVEETTKWAEGIMNAHPFAGAVVFFLLAAISAMLAFTSSVVLVPAANLVWGKLVTFVLLWGGWIAGAVVAYGIGNGARPLLVRFGYQEKLEKYQQFVSRRMKFWAAVVFCLAIPSEIPGYLLGGLRYPFFKFLGAIGIAELIYALGIVVAGESLLSANPLPLIAIVAGLIIIALSARLLLRTFKRSKSHVPGARQSRAKSN